MELFPKPPDLPISKLPVVWTPEAVNAVLRSIPRVVTGDGTLLKKVGDRHIIENPTETIRGDEQVRYFVVLEEFEDYLTCVIFNFSDTRQDYRDDLGTYLQDYNLTGTVMNVAKPYWLQQTVFESKSLLLDGDMVELTFPGIGQRNYTVSGESAIPQVLNPPYFAGDIISAQRGPTGLGTTDDPIAWADINTAGRAWVNDSGSGLVSINDDTTPDQTIGLGKAGTDINIAIVGNAWSSSTTYQKGWIVTSAGLTYRCILANTNQMPPNGTYWVEVTGDGLIVVNIPDQLVSINDDTTPQQTIGLGKSGSDINITTTASAWSGATTYQVGWIVSVAGLTYRCILAHTNHTPPNGTYWVEVTGDGLTIINIPSTGGGGASSVLVTVILPGTVAFVKDAASKFFRVVVKGAAGGGAGSDPAFFQSSAGGGGGAGGVAILAGPSSLLAASVVTSVGVGGVGGAAGPNAGSNGGNTSFGGVTANGGGGGNPMSTGTTAQFVAGGVGGTASGGDANIKGGDGGAGMRINGDAAYPGYGGASAIYSTQNTPNGQDGQDNGGGGSGGLSVNTSSGQAGGDGADGVIIVEEYL